MPTNLAESLGPHNTGWDGDIPGLIYPKPASLDTHSGDLTVGAGKKVEGVKVNGDIVVQGNDVEIIRCEARGIRKADGIFDTIVVASTIGDWDGHQPRSRQECVRGGSYTFHRVNGPFGFIDGFRPRAPITTDQCWVHSPFVDPTGFSGGPAHCDPCQPGNLDFGFFQSQDCRYDTWTFEPGQTAGGQMFGSLSPKPATAGMHNSEYGRNKNGRYINFFLDGNYSQISYVIWGNDNQDNFPPSGFVFAGGIIRRRGGRKYYGATAGWNFGKFDGPSPVEVTYGHIFDWDTGNAIPPNYKDGVNAGRIIPANDPSTYYTFDNSIFYGSPPPPPPSGEVWIPAAERDAMVNAYLAAQTGNEAARDAWAAIKADLAAYPITPA